MNVQRTPDGGYRIDLTGSEGRNLWYLLDDHRVRDALADRCRVTTCANEALKHDVTTLRNELGHA